MLRAVALVALGCRSFLSLNPKNVAQYRKLVRSSTPVAGGRSQNDLLAVGEAPYLVLVLPHEDAFVFGDDAIDFDFRIHSDRLPVGSVVPCDF